MELKKFKKQKEKFKLEALPEASTFKGFTDFEKNCERLTNTEQFIVDIISINGYTNKEVAKVRKVTVSAIKFHINGILKKLGYKTMRKVISMYHQDF